MGEEREGRRGEYEKEKARKKGEIWEEKKKG